MFFKECPFCHKSIFVLFYPSHIAKHTALRPDGQMHDHITLKEKQRYTDSLGTFRKFTIIRNAVRQHACRKKLLGVTWLTLPCTMSSLFVVVATTMSTARRYIGLKPKNVWKITLKTYGILLLRVSGLYIRAWERSLGFHPEHRS